MSKWMTPREVEAYLHVSYATLYLWRRQSKHLPYVKCGNGHVIYDPAAVKALRKILRPEGYMSGKEAAYLLGVNQIRATHLIRTIKTPANELWCHIDDVRAECARRGRGGEHA